jgi:hypothetical protein
MDRITKFASKWGLDVRDLLNIPRKPLSASDFALFLEQPRKIAAYPLKPAGKIASSIAEFLNDRSKLPYLMRRNCARKLVKAAEENSIELNYETADELKKTAGYGYLDPNKVRDGIKLRQRLIGIDHARNQHTPKVKEQLTKIAQILIKDASDEMAGQALHVVDYMDHDLRLRDIPPVESFYLPSKPEKRTVKLAGSSEIDIDRIAALGPEFLRKIGIDLDKVIEYSHISAKKLEEQLTKQQKQILSSVLT